MKGQLDAAKLGANLKLVKPDNSVQQPLRSKSQSEKPLSQDEVTHNTLLNAIKSLDIVKLTDLLDRLNDYTNEAKINICKNKSAYNILHYAVQAVNVPIIEIILRKVPELILYNTRDGDNALHLAVTRDNKDIINILLDEDQRLSKQSSDHPSLLEQENSSKDTPLQIAIKRGNKTAIKCIIKFICNEPLVDKLTKLGVDPNNEFVAKIIKKLELSNKILPSTSHVGKAEQPIVDYNNEEVIERILSRELKFQKYKDNSGKNNIVEVLNLEQPIEEQKVKDVISKLEGNNIRLCIPLHLGNDNWAGLTMQHTNDEAALRIVYIHPKGTPWTENEYVKNFILSIKSNDLRITNLPQHNASGSDNHDISALIILATFVNTAPTDLSASRYELYESTTKTGQDFDEERNKHLIMLDKNPVYGDCKMLAILQGSLEGGGKQIKVLPVLNMSLINLSIINQAIDLANGGNHLVIPVKTYQGGWACMIFKNLSTGELTLITQDPMGDAMCNNTRGWFDVLTTIFSRVQFVNIYDLRKVQTNNIEDTGTITADNIKNIMKLPVLNGLPGSEFYKNIKDKESLNIPLLRKADNKVLIDHDIPVDDVYYNDIVSLTPTTDEEVIITGDDLLHNQEYHG